MVNNTKKTHVTVLKGNKNFTLDYDNFCTYVMIQKLIVTIFVVHYY